MALKLSVRSRDRIGIAIHSDAIYGVHVRGDDVVRSAQERLDDESLSSVQGAFVAILSHLATPHAQVAVAMGATRMQARCLTGLPAMSDARRLSQLVQCNAQAYFVKNGIPLVTSGVDVRTPGEGWSAAAELPSLELIYQTCAAQSLALTVVVPSVIALPYATGVADISWRDGAVLVTASYDQQRRVVTYRRKQWSEGFLPASPPCETAGLDAALGATRVPSIEPLAIRPAAFQGQHRKRVSNGALAQASACLLAVCTGYVLIPVGVARHITRTAVPRAGDIHAARTAASTERALATTTAILEGLAKFSAERTPITLFLFHLTEAIPPEMAVLDLRTDDLGGSITVLGPRVSEVQSRVSAVPEVANAEFSGAITGAMVGSERLERVTLRFTWRGVRHRIGQR